ncbi:MAG: hypothetical protein AAB552_02380 [Patescibacteria group bacterium]
MSEESGTLSTTPAPGTSTMIVGMFFILIFDFQLLALITSLNMSREEALSSTFMCVVLWANTACCAVLALEGIWDSLTNTGIKADNKDIVTFSLNKKEDDADSNIGEIFVFVFLAMFSILGLNSVAIMSFSLLISTVLWAVACFIPFIPTEKE